jgi:hypothetical protein
MRRAAARIAVVVTLLGLFAPGRAAAAGDDDLITLEWLIGNSALVVRGRLVGGDDVAQFLTSGQLATVEVDETLKGPTLPRVRFFSQGLIISPKRDRGAPVLLCLEHHEGAAAGSADMEWSTHAELGSRSIVFLEPQRLAQLSRRGIPFTVDLRPLRRPEDVLAVARSSLDKLAFRSGQVLLYAGPWAQPLDLDPRFEPRTISLPLLIDPEEIVQTYIKSSRPEMRALGVELLFCAAQTPYRDALKSLLDDPAYRESGQGPWAVRQYPIRQRAYEVLTYDGVTASHPITEGTLAHYGRPHWARWTAIAIGVVLVLAAVAVLARRRRLRGTTMDVGAPGLGLAVALLLTGIIAWAWIASRRHATELVVTAGGARHRIASYRGGIQYMFVRSWPERAGVAVGSFAYGPEVEGAWQWHTASGASAVISGALGQAAYQYTLAIAQTQSQIDALRARQTASRAQGAATTQSQALDLRRVQLESQLSVQLNARAAVLGQSRSSITSSQALVNALLTRPPPPLGPYVKERAPRSHWQRLGLSRTTGQLTGPDGAVRPYIAVRVEYPWLLAPPLVIALGSLLRWQRRRRRVARGLCGRCGYDLRASRERCPECGAAHPHPSLTPCPVMR